MEGEADPLEVGFGEPRPGHQPTDSIGVGHRKDSGRPRLGWSHMPPLNQSHGRHRSPWVAIGRRPDRERKMAAVAQHPPRLAQRRRGVGHEHVAPAADHTVHAVVVKVHPLGVQHAVLDIGESPILAEATGDIDHLRREVRGDHATRIPDPACNLEAQIARPGSDLEEGLPRLRIGPLHDPIVDPAGELHYPLVSVPPARCHLPPGLEALLAIGIRVKIHAIPPVRRFAYSRRYSVAINHRHQSQIGTWA
jgi:hypothetical protein